MFTTCKEAVRTNSSSDPVADRRMTSTEISPARIAERCHLSAEFPHSNATEQSVSVTAPASCVLPLSWADFTGSPVPWGDRVTGLRAGMLSALTSVQRERL